MQLEVCKPDFDSKAMSGKLKRIIRTLVSAVVAEIRAISRTADATMSRPIIWSLPRVPKYVRIFVWCRSISGSWDKIELLYAA